MVVVSGGFVFPKSGRGSIGLGSIQMVLDQYNQFRWESVK